jgi:hypothetical protein
MADTIEVYDELFTILGRIKGLLHGIYASAEFYADKSAELKMNAIAQELVEEAQALIENLHQAGQKPSGGKVE